MIQFNNITKSFKSDFWAKKNYALNDVSFKVEPGEMTGFLGANGAGKTTSLKILMGFISQDSGSVNFSNSLGKSQSEIFSKIGYLPERPYFYPDLTGREFTQYMGKLNDVAPQMANERIQKWAKYFQVDHALDRKIRTYSKGMLQRLGFVSVLVHDPELIILDEPLSGLDPVGRKEIKDVMVDLHKEGKTIFFSSHIVSDVEEVCNKVIVLEKSKLLYEGSIESLIIDNASLDYRFRLLLKNKEKREKFKHHEVQWLEEASEQIIQVPSLEKNTILESIDLDMELYELSQIRPSLEQIVYKIRS
jgi:ABC-2 type transport system ATP-binding protein